MQITDLFFFAVADLVHLYPHILPTTSKRWRIRVTVRAPAYTVHIDRVLLST